MTTRAIIWDCDGVLIDSEAIACGVIVDVMREHGSSITLDEFIPRYMGKKWDRIIGEVEHEYALDLRRILPVDDLRSRWKAAFDKDLKAIPHIHEVLEKIPLLHAVASGSGGERLEYTLRLTGLTPYFKGHVYSSDLVKNGKPAPDVFLLAAEKLGIPPADCLVIEDSVHGIAGARAAGMDACAFTGGSHITEKMRKDLEQADVKAVFSDIRELFPFLELRKN